MRKHYVELESKIDSIENNYCVSVVSIVDYLRMEHISFACHLAFMVLSNPNDSIIRI